MRKKTLPTPIDLIIDRFSAKGNGLGKETLPSGGQRIVEVPFTLPGEQVRATFLRKKRAHAKAKLEEVLVPSPDRIDPACKHFGQCGGCRLQHLSYSGQLLHKEKMIRQLLSDVLDENTVFHPILGCQPPWQYRNKMEYTFSMNREGERFLGLIMEGSKHHVLNLQECHLVHPWFTECQEVIRQWWASSGLLAYHPYRNTGTLRTLTLRESFRTADRLVMLTVSGNPEFAPTKVQINSLVSSLRNAIELHDGSSKLSIFLRIQQIAKGMATNFYEMLLYGPEYLREEMVIQASLEKNPERLKFNVSPTSFFQPNPRQAEMLYSRAMQMAALQPEDVVYDLYCGTGTLGISAASSVKEVIGVEVSPEAALDARTNAKLNKLDNVTIYVGAVHHVLEQIEKVQNGKLPSLVIIDPPRVGLESSVQKLITHLKSHRILYISCNPASLAADIQTLKNEGYHLVEVQPVDMFPQTMHVENIALLKRDTL